jgi:hypothetical protein
MSTNVDQYFAYHHLPSHLQEVSRPFSELLELLESAVPDGPEKSAGARKLLEAIFCYVRAKLSAK